MIPACLEMFMAFIFKETNCDQVRITMKQYYNHLGKLKSDPDMTAAVKNYGFKWKKASRDKDTEEVTIEYQIKRPTEIENTAYKGRQHEPIVMKTLALIGSGNIEVDMKKAGESSKITDYRNFIASVLKTHYQDLDETV